jgi:hypothetical protein
MSSPSCCHYDFWRAQSHGVHPCFQAVPKFDHTSDETGSSNSAHFMSFSRFSTRMA